MLHLAQRFFGFLTAKPLSPSDQVFVATALTPGLLRLFYTQRREDQRHALDVAHRVETYPHLVEAALLHDIGKATMGLGAIGRSLATLWALTSLPLWGEWLTYIEHGRIGADMLENDGAGNLAVSFARHHPGEPPADWDTHDWNSLTEADHA